MQKLGITLRPSRASSACLKHLLITSFLDSVTVTVILWLLYYVMLC